MPELKNLFIKGKMNKDLDERLVPQGEYRDALNVSVSYSEGSDVGALQNILGNTERVKNRTDINVPIDLNTPSTFSTLTFPSGATCIGTVRDTENDKIYWFGTSATADYIAELNPSDNSVDIILCDTGSILNFSTSNLITGVAVLDGILYFTDDLNEPRQVDIEYWRGVTGENFTATSSNLSDDRISLYKKGPLDAPTFETINQSLRGGAGTLGGAGVTFTKNFFTTEIDDTFTGNFSIDPNYQVGDIIEMKNSFQTEYGEDIESILRVEITVHSDPGTSFTGKLLSKTSKIEDASVVYTCLLEEEEPLFELKFAKFAYRYKYTNGQFSVMSPFSLPAFIPGDFEYNGQEGYNLGMVNTVRELKLEGWFTTPATNNYQADIEEIEVLYKDSVSPNVYIVEALKKSGGNFPATFEVKDEQIYKAAQSNQILRPFDSIPKKAKALEITGNRLIFGNYQQNFNVTTNPSFTISAISRTDTTQSFSIKSGRAYQLGIVGQDKYGRQTPVFTDTSGVIKIDGSKSDLNLALRVNASFLSLPAELTHYKYYIKEVSNPYYNICVSNVYEDNKTGYIYCAFPSSETNKVSEDDILILKKQSGDNAYKITSNSKFKVLDKNSEPPNFLATKEIIAYEATTVKFAHIYGADGIQTTKKAGSTPVPGHNTIQLERAFRPGDDADADVSSQFVAQCTTGAKVKFKRSGTTNKSNIYTIKSFSIEPDGGQEEVELTFEEQFGEDVNVIYTSNADNAEYSCQMEFIKSEDDTGNPEYAGKFFVKLNNSSQLKQALIGAFDESSLNTLATTVEFDAFDGTGENRLYWYTRVSTSTAALGAITVSNYTLPAGFHVVIQTQENLTDGASDYETDPFAPALVVGNYVRFSGYTALDNNFDNISEYPNYKIVEVITWDDNNRRNYALKFNKLLEYDFPSTGQLDTNTAARQTKFRVDVREPSLEGAKTPINPPVFEIEPEDGVLDIYYETEKTYPISNLSTPTELDLLDYTNCISFNNGVESDRIRDDFNAPTIGKGVRVSTVFEDNYGEERIKSGLIFSGIYNGKNGINRLNQFIIAENITEEANPIYGGIQKLNTRDTDLTLLCDDKILKVPARKDLLFQADGNPQVTSTDRFLGTIIPYAGNYGCQHPESFADHIYRAYFVDRTRGKVLRLGGDGITEISNYGMKDYFKDKLVAETGYMFGSYDENKDKYNISLPVENTVVSFSEGVNGWPTRLSFYEMESGISLNNMYYTFKNGKIFSHDNETRNTFYGAKTDSEVTFYLNGNPGNAKNFRTLNYQGDSGWTIKSALDSNSDYFGITTDKQTGDVSSFIEKEGIYYNYISGEAQTTKASLDLKALNVQGLGTPTSISSNNATFTDLNNAIQIGDKVFNNSNSDIRTVQNISGNTITVDAAPANAFSYFAKDNRFNTSGVLGYYAEITMTNTSTDKKELYSVGSEVSLSS
jgi:hypothetical protein